MTDETLSECSPMITHGWYKSNEEDFVLCSEVKDGEPNPATDQPHPPGYALKVDEQQVINI